MSLTGNPYVDFILICGTLIAVLMALYGWAHEFGDRVRPHRD
jgi:hypothetical protein